MAMLLDFVFFTGGFVILILGAQSLVNGASSIGKMLNVSQMVMGLTVVALGTSLPELIVNIFAGIQNKTDLAIGNILGSNITNTLLVIGAASLFYPVAVGKKSFKFDVPFSLFTVVILFLLLNDSFFGREDKINRIDGIILLVFFSFFIYTSFFKPEKEDKTLLPPIKTYSVPFSIIMIMGGGLGLYFGGKWIVDSALVIAKSIGISETAMGLTIVAGATSLPELVTSIIAAKKRNTAMAFGNAIGSNILNITLVLGVTSLVKPIPFASHLNIELSLVFASGIMLMIFIKTGKTKNTIARFEGLFLILLYFAFIYFSTNYQ